MPFENKNGKTSRSEFYLPKVQIKDYNFKIDGRNFFDQPINNNIKTCENIGKNATGQGDDYTTGCLLDYLYFRENYKLIAIDLSKQQALDADLRAIQQINLTAKIDRAGNITIFFIIEEAEETVLEFSQETVIRVLLNMLQNNIVFSNIKWLSTIVYMYDYQIYGLIN